MFNDIVTAYYEDWKNARHAYKEAKLDAKKREFLDGMTIALQLMSLALDVASKAAYVKSTSVGTIKEKDSVDVSAE